MEQAEERARLEAGGSGRWGFRGIGLSGWGRLGSGLVRGLGTFGLIGPWAFGCLFSGCKRFNKGRLIKKPFCSLHGC